MRLRFRDMCQSLENVCKTCLRFFCVPADGHFSSKRDGADYYSWGMKFQIAVL